MQDEINDSIVETGDRQHVNVDGETDAQKGARAGGIGGAVTGAVAGSLMGPGGALLGAAVGGLVGAVASMAAVGVVDKIDGDSATDFNAEPIEYDHTQLEEHRYHDVNDTVGNGIPGVQTGGYANDGTPDTRGMMEKTADAVTGDNVDDKTGKVIDDRTSLPNRPVDNRYDDTLGNGIPGIQTGGHAVDGTPDTRGISEKTADALTGDNIDDKTGRVVSDGPPPLIDNGVPGVQTGGHANDGTPDTRGMSEKLADGITGDNIDDKTGKVVDDTTNRPIRG